MKLNLDLPLYNSALVEVYDNTYRKMKYHSDQCLDIAEDSYIALYSCYEYPIELSPSECRVLKVRNKETELEEDIILTENSVVIFAIDTNRSHQHKIILEENQKANRWLGFTFRLSKKHVRYLDGKVLHENGEYLKLASDDERKEFYKLKGEENRNPMFEYPCIDFTLSQSDLIPPTGL